MYGARIATNARNNPLHRVGSVEDCLEFVIVPQKSKPDMGIMYIPGMY